MVDMLPWVAFAAFLGAVEVGLGQVDRVPVAYCTFVESIYNT